jgi:hypothetical protein
MHVASTKGSHPMNPMIADLIKSSDRPSIVAMLANETIPLETLRAGVYAMLGGDPREMLPSDGGPPSLAKAAPDASAAAVTAPAGKKKAGRPKKEAAPVDAASPAALAVSGLVATGQGFAKADVIKVSGCSPAQAGTALKNAMGAGQVKQFGDRRFSRYGKTEAIAKAASEAAQGK